MKTSAVGAGGSLARSLAFAEFSCAPKSDSTPRDSFRDFGRAKLTGMAAGWRASGRARRSRGARSKKQSGLIWRQLMDSAPLNCAGSIERPPITSLARATDANDAPPLGRGQTGARPQRHFLLANRPSVCASVRASVRLCARALARLSVRAAGQTPASGGRIKSPLAA